MKIELTIMYVVSLCSLDVFTLALRTTIKESQNMNICWKFKNDNNENKKKSKLYEIIVVGETNKLIFKKNENFDIKN